MTRCRTCTSRNLYLFLPLGSHPLANGFLTKEQLAEPEPTFSLDAHVCLDCGLIQVEDNVPPGYFRNYVYIPSTSDVMRAHFDDLAATLRTRFLRDDALAVDIGCNDGLFLSSLNRRGARTLGIDPAENIAQLARDSGVEVLNAYFTPAVAERVRAERGSANLIVTTNTFHHVDDLDEFTAAVRILLADDGVFVVEVPHALELVEKNEFDGVYHEHVSQLTVKSFVELFRRFGLGVFELERLDVHGGSIRVFARLGSTSVPASVQAWIDEEERRGLFAASTYDALRERVEQNRHELMLLLTGLKSEGRRIAGYGASARGNTLLNYYGIGPDVLDFIADRNPLKQGLYTPGMHIPVRAAEAIAAEQPDYVLLIAWNFADEIIGQQSTYAGLGGKFIVPIPEVEVRDGVAALT